MICGIVETRYRRKQSKSALYFIDVQRLARWLAESEVEIWRYSEAWLNAADCKFASSGFGGSNPSISTLFHWCLMVSILDFHSGGMGSNPI